ncbi:MAG: glutathione S-transferase N-terminal domain-containing protein [Polyangiaceae bacterium]|nr:glutathione S-transferase N-terminal domain-containing protein [Polyangiaceae bacterium]
MKLYYMPGACPLVAHITLEWAGATYEAVRLSHAELKAPEFLAVNPLGAVPALEVDGRVLTQNTGILAYLSATFPEAKFEGDGSALSRAEVWSWLGFCNSDVHPAFKPMFGATSYLEDEQAITKSKDEARRRLRGLFEYADKGLTGRDWLAGTRSVADAYLYVLLRWSGPTNVDLSGLDQLARFRAKMEADPGVQRALAAQGIS